MTDITQSAIAHSLAATGLDLSAEIIVRIYPGCAPEYQGTRAALVAEGFIPANLQWPTGFTLACWEDQTFRYWIQRQRPKGVKGARKHILDIDWWSIRINQLRPPRPPIASEQDCAEWDAHWEAYVAASRDKSFQSMKSLIPGVKRARRSASTANQI